MSGAVPENLEDLGCVTCSAVLSFYGMFCSLHIFSWPDMMELYWFLKCSVSVVFCHRYGELLVMHSTLIIAELWLCNCAKDDSCH